MATATHAANQFFRKATREQIRLRFGIDGPPGSGKTFTMLRFAHVLQAHIRATSGNPERAGIAVISTEKNIEGYLDDDPDEIPFDFDIFYPKSYSPTSYTEAIQIANSLPRIEILIIDSLSHAWSGSDGALEQVDKRAAKSSSGNTHFAWREVTPMHNKMIDAILGTRCHLFASLRTKVDYIHETVNGKTVPKKIGLAPVQRAGMEYEFDIYGSMDQETHTLSISKTRCRPITDAIAIKPGAAFMVPIIDWLMKGSPVPKGFYEPTEADLKTRELAEVNGLSIEEKARRAAARRKSATAAQPAQTDSNGNGNGHAAATGNVSSAPPPADVLSPQSLEQLRKEYPLAYDTVADFKAVLAKYGPALSTLTQSQADSLLCVVLAAKSEKRARDAKKKFDESGTENPNGTGCVGSLKKGKTKTDEPAGEAAGQAAAEPTGEAATEAATEEAPFDTEPAATTAAPKRNQKPTKATLARILELRTALYKTPLIERAKQLLTTMATENGTLEYEQWSRSAANAYLEKLNELAQEAGGHSPPPAEKAKTAASKSVETADGTITKEQHEEISRLADELGWAVDGDKGRTAWLRARGISSFRSLNMAQAEELIGKMQKWHADRAAKAASKN
jgi:hypothetical protein